MGMFFYAEKQGMMSHFDENGVCRPATVLKVFPSVVLREKSVAVDGYKALVVGSVDCSKKHIRKPQLSLFTSDITPKRHIHEVFIDCDDIAVGQVIDWSCFADAKKVDVKGKTIGKGFQGVMKRHGFGGLRASHGVSISHRSHGSTGGRQDPGKVFKGKKMAGHMGNTIVTCKNLSVSSFDSERGILVVFGSVPGKANSLLQVRCA